MTDKEVTVGRDGVIVALLRIEQVMSEIRVGARHNLGDELSYPKVLIGNWLELLGEASEALTGLAVSGGKEDDK